ncbi:hypothetical protein GLOIN_2v1782279 [Rhizophagus irregularis DAOM 181602=DAOM 197198]|uniref:CCHC-type domain-containing protein n=1 Tax=Rhizophagus irregularis (strain DAOM 181602 / DAOM 197198 / MUCL 43194) TaxID=747089 RepID=A0A2P4PHY9_RHIID|nr:hypothetical protein GLOIN_2v1782279 [Rhizophagus irregularis DAOM 181602=DAOM 197198]POG65005.1 hypothetical protein GLOIN_2v1782279 [Rhizophagus irregularis DAOM 181602=DAOM 197198]|eukprot:XP_025171871.1 hypothetical protein GLOIN_2v1782279 [Rhizophagus irregularis DAOM 181602=DAOM 197198]
MIPARWYKDNIINLDCSFENSPVLSAIEPVDTLTSSVLPFQNNFTLQSLRYFQGVEHIQPNEIMRQNNSKRNRFGFAFSTAKTAINHLIGQITNPNVTKIRGAPSKKRLKSAMELSKKWVPMQENLNDPNYQVAKSQRRCLLCGKPGHYQKKCPNARDGKYREKSAPT